VSKLAETLPAAPDPCHHLMPMAQDPNAHPADVVKSHYASTTEATFLARCAIIACARISALLTKLNTAGSFPELGRGLSRLSAIADFLLAGRGSK
jgi:hypothetical protein